MTEAYKLKIVLDDSQIKHLNDMIMNIGNGGTQTQNKGFLGLGQNVSSNSKTKSIAKLGIIAGGVLGLVALLSKLTSMFVQSSPMIQQMLKLLNFGIMMILRPIGDFIGFMLRPIILLFLRNFIIPFYRTTLPLMIKLGDIVGTKIAGGIDNLIKLIIGLSTFLTGFFIRDLELENKGRLLMETAWTTLIGIDTKMHTELQLVNTHIIDANGVLVNVENLNKQMLAKFDVFKQSDVPQLTKAQQWARDNGGGIKLDVFYDKLIKNLQGGGAGSSSLYNINQHPNNSNITNIDTSHLKQTMMAKDDPFNFDALTGVFSDLADNIKDAFNINKSTSTTNTSKNTEYITQEIDNSINIEIQGNVFDKKKLEEIIRESDQQQYSRGRRNFGGR